MSEARCRGIDDHGYYWGADAIDPSEPDFVKGKGIWMSNFVPCGRVPEPGKQLCYRHRFIEDSKAIAAIQAGEDKQNG